MTIGAVSGAGASYRGITGQTSFGPAGKSEFEKILEEFKKVASETPASRARSAVLKSHGLTEDSYKALKGADREAIDKEIEKAVRLALKAQGNDAPTALDI